MNKHILSGVCLAGLSLGSAFAAPVTVNTNQNFSVANQSIFGSGSAASFNQSLRTGPSAAQIYAEAQASSGQVSSSGTASLSLSYDNLTDIGDAGSLAFNLFGNATASFSTFFGATLEAGLSTSVLGIGDIALIDEGYSLSAGGSGATLATNASGTDNEPFARVGVPQAVPINGGVSANAAQTSTLDLIALNGNIAARNLTSGTIVNQAFSLTAGSNNFGFNFNLAEVGNWEISLTSLSLANTFTSAIGVSISGDAGYVVGFNCGEPSTDSDNGFGCVSDDGVKITSSPLNFANIPGFALLYGGLGRASLGTVSVLAADEVPLPGAFPLMAGGLAAFAAWRRRKAA
ncbi:MAG: VPLPA-CTERM sorting domain-containing protein [Parvularcula sp.]|jgi:hypothetical protein|nr:VPLPA-CTERM sorting domain-containing protein [Parvularcula sp.]